MPRRRPVRRTNTPTAPVKPGFSLAAVFRGLVFALAFALIAFVVLSLLFTLTLLPDQYMIYAAYATSFIAVLLGGRYATVRAGGAGLLHGGAVGLAYAFLLGGVAALIATTPLKLSLAGLSRPLMDVLAGIIGGILGGGQR